MSMSQEEIESLMNGIDLGEDQPAAEETPEVESAPMSEDDIANLIAETEESADQASDAEDNTPVSEDDIDKLLAEMEDSSAEETSNESEEVKSEDIDALMASIESMDDPKPQESEEAVSEPVLEEEPQESSKPVSSDDIDALLAENLTEDEDETSEESSDDNIDDILASLEAEGSLTEEPTVEAVKEEVEEPMPSDAETVSLTSGDESTKVVNQLSQVANDSEEKAVKILDVLGDIMDSNYEHLNQLKAMNEFMVSQEALLQTLTQKFPNVEQFSAAMTQLQEVKESPSAMLEKLESENTELFTAMELMQYHDINRQKIERVMSVIRKLSMYLNDIFEDTEAHEISTPVAKHIHGDESADLIGNDDLDALISEFASE